MSCGRGRTGPRLRWLTALPCRRAANSMNSARKRARRLTNYEHDCLRLRRDLHRMLLLRLLLSRRGLRGRDEDAARVSTRAQGIRLRKPARPEFRIQGRQGSRRGLSDNARVARGRSSRDPGRDWAAGAGYNNRSSISMTTVKEI